jgi:hypothetical protein
VPFGRNSITFKCSQTGKKISCGNPKKDFEKKIGFSREEKDRLFFSKDNPGEFVTHGKYGMRIRDKALIGHGRLRLNGMVQALLLIRIRGKEAKLIVDG